MCTPDRLNPPQPNRGVAQHDRPAGISPHLTLADETELIVGCRYIVDYVRGTDGVVVSFATGMKEIAATARIVMIRITPA